MNKKHFCDPEIVISLVEKKPVLWNKQSPTYKHKELTRVAWQDICRSILSGFDQLNPEQQFDFSRTVMRKWWNVRDAYVRSIRRDREARRRGVRTESRKYIYEDKLQFLSNVIDHQTDEDQAENETEEDFNWSHHSEETAPSCSSVPVQDFHEEPQIRLEQPENRHMCFFKAILPSVNCFDDDDTIEFQLGVLQLISVIKKKKKE